MTPANTEIVAASPHLTRNNANKAPQRVEASPHRQFSPTALLREAAAERPEWISGIVDEAIKGDFRSRELIMAYLDGKPVQRSIDISLTGQFDAMMGGFMDRLAARLLDSAAQAVEAPATVVEGSLAVPDVTDA